MDRFRVGAWHADHRIAYVAPTPSGIGPSPGGVRACVERLRGEGYVGAVTSALRDDEARSFIAAGFSPQESLRVLRRSVDDVPAIDLDGAHHRRARRRDRAAVLEVDHAAFAPFWQLDEPGLSEAIEATPSSRFRVVDSDGVVAYAICGRAERLGYLQRLAVHPDHAGRQLGSMLVWDALKWLRRRGARQALVNTQESNVGAVSLYQRLGFELDHDRLHVLRSQW